MTIRLRVSCLRATSVTPINAKKETKRSEYCRELAKLASGTSSSIIDIPRDLIYTLTLYILFSQFVNIRLSNPCPLFENYISTRKQRNCATTTKLVKRASHAIREPSTRNKLQIAAAMRGSQLYIEAATCDCRETRQSRGLSEF